MDPSNKVEECPPLYPHLKSVYQAYLTLAAMRQHGMAGPQPIQFGEICAYSAAIRGSTSLPDLVYFITCMDAELFEHMAEEEKARKAQEGSGK